MAIFQNANWEFDSLRNQVHTKNKIRNCNDCHSRCPAYTNKFNNRHQMSCNLNLYFLPRIKPQAKVFNVNPEIPHFQLKILCKLYCTILPTNLVLIKSSLTLSFSDWIFTYHTVMHKQIQNAYYIIKNEFICKNRLVFLFTFPSHVFTGALQGILITPLLHFRAFLFFAKEHQNIQSRTK